MVLWVFIALIKPGFHSDISSKHKFHAQFPISTAFHHTNVQVNENKWIWIRAVELYSFQLKTFGYAFLVIRFNIHSSLCFWIRQPYEQVRKANLLFPWWQVICYFANIYFIGFGFIVFQRWLVFSSKTSGFYIKYIVSAIIFLGFSELKFCYQPNELWF